MPSVPDNNPQTASHLDRLRLRLTALRRPAEIIDNGRRVLDAADPLAAIALEVDETLLPRCLFFENDRGDCLALEVASGRVLSVARAEIAAVGDTLSGLPGHPFFDADDPMCALLHRALTGFAEGCGTLTVRANIVQEPQGFTNIGVTLRGLERHAAPEPATPARPLFQVMQEARGMTLAAMVYRNRQVADSWGGAAERDRLAQLALEEIGDTAPEDIDAPRRMLAWGGDLDSSVFYVLLGSGADLAFLAVPAPKLGPVTRLWLGHQAR